MKTYRQVLFSLIVFSMLFSPYFAMSTLNTPTLNPPTLEASQRLIEPVSFKQLEVFDQHGAVMLLIAPETGEIVYANIAASGFYGYPLNQLEGMSLNEINQLSPEEIAEEMQTAVSEHRNFFEFRHRISSGEIRDVEVYSYPLTMVEGNQLLFSIVHDVTEKKEGLVQARRNSAFIMIHLAIFFACAIVFSLWVYRQKRKIDQQHTHMKALFDHMEDYFCIYQVVRDVAGVPIDYIVSDANTAFLSLVDKPRVHLIGTPIRNLFPNFERHWRGIFDYVAIKGQATAFTDFDADASRHYRINCYAPEPDLVAVLMSDTTSFENIHQNMEYERHYYHRMLNSLGQGVVALNLDGHVTMINEYAAKLLCLSRDEALGQHHQAVLAFETKGDIAPIDPFNDLQREMAFDLDLRNCHGELIPIALTIKPVPDVSGDLGGVVITIQDFSEVKEKESQIRYLSYHDQLTGIYNRRYYEEALLRLDTCNNLPLSLVMLDVNGLKMTNDAFGHQAGDFLIQNVAKCLKGVCRADDIVARIGGDEFALLLPKTDEPQLKRIVEGMCLGESGVKPINMHTEEGDFPLLLSYALGTVTKHTKYENMDNLIKTAEGAMYAQKLKDSHKVREKMLQVMLQKLHECQPEENIHTQRVSRLLKVWAIKLEMDPAVVKELERLGQVHDIGKLIIPRRLLDKTPPLTEEDWCLLRRHSESGFHILKSVEGYGAIAEAVLCHHEYWDGTGYPRGIKGPQTHWMSRMLAIADAFEAMTAGRPYQEKISVEEALLEIKQDAGTQFDPEWVASLVANFTVDDLKAI